MEKNLDYLFDSADFEYILWNNRLFPCNGEYVRGANDFVYRASIFQLSGSVD